MCTPPRPASPDRRVPGEPRTSVTVERQCAFSGIVIRYWVNQNTGSDYQRERGYLGAHVGSMTASGMNEKGRKVTEATRDWNMIPLPPDTVSIQTRTAATLRSGTLPRPVIRVVRGLRGERGRAPNSPT